MASLMENLITVLNKQYTEYEMTECFLRLEKSSEEREGKDVTIWKLVWYIELNPTSLNDVHSILFDAQTGKVLNVEGWICQKDY